MSDFNSLPAEASPQLTDRAFLARGNMSGAERAALLSAISALFAAEAQALTNKTSYNGVALSGVNTPALSVNGTASVAGDNTGDQTNIPGNAATATALQTARTINGVSFNGTVNITITAAAGTLTGTTINATVVNSSLTTFGNNPQLNGTIGGNGTLAGNRLSGLVPIANLATGTPDGSKFVRDDGTLAVPTAVVTGLFTWEFGPNVSSFGDYSTARPAGSRHHTCVASAGGSGYIANFIINTDNSPEIGDIVTVPMDFTSDRSITILFYSGSAFGLGIFQFTNELGVARRVEFRFVYNGSAWAAIHTQEIYIRDLQESMSPSFDDYAVIDGPSGGTRKIVPSNL
jgi:hypothetical protein